MGELSVLEMINDRLGKLEELPKTVAELAAQVQGMKESLDDRTDDLKTTVAKLEGRVDNLERQVGPVDPRQPVSSRLDNIERSLSTLARLAWIVVAGIIAVLAEPLLSLLGRLLALVQ